MYLIPWLSLLYLLSFLDRTSIGNAKLYSMLKDLHMTDSQYLIALTVFFFSYALFEVPSNILLKRFRPSRWLSVCMFLWGVSMMSQGLVKNDAGLVATRFILGVWEACLFPGVAYILSCWYKRDEFGIRLAIFFSAATVSGAFGGLLAFAISHMNGVGGKAGWSWIFIIEGLATIVAGILSFWFIQDFPDNAKFLTEAERAVVIRRLQDDEQWSVAGEAFQFRFVMQSVLDWKTWVGMLIYAALDAPLYAFALFLPSIIAELGFTANRANLLSIPVFVYACAMTIFVGFMADRSRARAKYNLICFGMGIVGASILIGSRNAALSYVAVYILGGGIYPLIPNTAAWVANNVEGAYKRGVTIAMVVGFGNINGAVSSNIYRAKDAPWYRFGHSFMLGYLTLGFICTLIMAWGLKRENMRRASGERGERIMDDPSTHHHKGREYSSVAEARRELGDQFSGFTYVL